MLVNFIFPSSTLHHTHTHTHTHTHRMKSTSSSDPPYTPAPAVPEESKVPDVVPPLYADLVQVAMEVIGKYTCSEYSGISCCTVFNVHNIP